MIILKISRAFFVLIETVANAALLYLVPLIPSMPLQLFTVISVNAAIAYLATDVTPNGQPSAGT